MKKVGVLGSLFAAAMMVWGSSSADALKLPRPSPRAKVVQYVGVTKIKLKYFSPGVKKRTIWGKLVPFGKLWRTGANGATTIIFNTDVNIGGKDVKAGTYAIFTIPGQKEWSVMINTNYKTGGTRGYKKENNVAEFKVTPTAAPFRERMTFLFANTTDNTATLNLEWEKLRLSIPIKVDTNKNAAANINKALKRGWRPYYTSANFFLSSGQLKKAEQYINTSIAIEKNWWNVWAKARVLAAKKQYKEAIAHANGASALGAKDNIFTKFFAPRVKKALVKWAAASAPAPAPAPAVAPAPKRK